MKLTIEKEEWQLLGQLVVEIRQHKYPALLILQAMMIHEFAAENAQAFELPERRARKLKYSMVFALHTYLQWQPLRNDTFWDIILLQFREKVASLFRNPNPGLTQNVGY